MKPILVVIVVAVLVMLCIVCIVVLISLNRKRLLRGTITAPMSSVPVTSSAQPTSPTPPVSAGPRVAIALTPEDVPKFKRVYEVVVGDGIKITVKMRDRYYSFTSPKYERTDEYCELTQRNGKYILFDVHAVADKIIDRELYPLVQAQVDRILAMDAAFVKSRPNEFVDESGQRWVRALPNESEAER